MNIPPVRVSNPRCQILVEYAKWTALSAVRVPNSPIKDKKTVYRLLDGVAFAEVLSGAEVSAERFDAWHRCETRKLRHRADEHLGKVAQQKGQDPPAAYPVGWSAKLINVFLKTAVYAGGLGRKGLGDVLHPPLDNGLRTGLIEYFHGRSDMLEKGSPAYRTVIEGCCVAAKELGCSLIEVEQLAGLGLLPGEAPPRQAGQPDLPRRRITGLPLTDAGPIAPRIPGARS